MKTSLCRIQNLDFEARLPPLSLLPNQHRVVVVAVDAIRLGLGLGSGSGWQPKDVPSRIDAIPSTATSAAGSMGASKTVEEEIRNEDISPFVNRRPL